MSDKAKLLELAAALDAKAIEKLEAYIDSGNRRSNYDMADRLDDAGHLLICAAALKALSANIGEEGK